MRTCSIEGCGNKHRARGLCATHYNQQLPNRHRKVEHKCDLCGSTMLKQLGQEKRYTHMYCSQLCRDYARFGPTSCTIPRDHWARWYGVASEWNPPVIRNTGECAWCGGHNPRHLSAAYCSLACKKRASKVRRKGREHGAPGEYTWAQVTRLWLRLDRACAYCRQPTPLSQVDPDHVVPLSRGGLNSQGNILPSCRACNSDKRDLLLHEWDADRERRGLAPRTTSWSANDKRYTHLVIDHALAA